MRAPAYREAATSVGEAIEFELETCKRLLGTEPIWVMELLATVTDWTDLLEPDEFPVRVSNETECLDPDETWF